MRKNEAKWIESRERWQINVQKDGERRTFQSSHKGTKGKIEAEKKADKWLETGQKKLKVRLGSLYPQFLEEIKTLTSTPNYIKHEQIGRLWLLPKLKQKRVLSIIEQDWQNCINEAYKQGKSKKTLEHIRGSITALCRYARKQGILLHRPEDLIIPKDAPIYDKQILQPDDIKKLFSKDTITYRGWVKPVFHIHAFRFIVLTGVRRGELCFLKQSHIKNGIVSIKGSINSLGEETTGKTKNARRWFALSKHAHKVLTDQKKLLKDRGIISPYLFPDEEGKRLDPNYLYYRWVVYGRQHEITCNLHEMRHTFISISKSDVPEELLKQIVGHSKSMDTFGIYGHEVDGDVERAASILDDIFDTFLE